MSTAVYCYSPPPLSKFGRLLILASILFGLGLSFLGVYFQIKILKSISLIVDLVLILICSRFLITSFTYMVEEDDSGRADFVVIEKLLKKRTEVCRIAILGSKYYAPSPDLKRPDGTFFNYTSGFNFSGCGFIVPNEADGSGVIKIIPDKTLNSLLKRYGAVFLEE